MLLPTLIKDVPKEIRRDAGRLRKWAFKIFDTLSLVAVGYLALWLVCVLIICPFFIALGISRVGAGPSFDVMAIACFAILAPVNIIVGMGDLAENFLPINKKDIPTRETVALLAWPLLTSLGPFLVVWMFGIASIFKFLILCALFFLASVEMAYSEKTAEKSAKAKKGSKG